MKKIDDQVIERAIMMAVANISFEDDFFITEYDIKDAKDGIKYKIKEKGGYENGSARHVG